MHSEGEVSPPRKVSERNYYQLHGTYGGYSVTCYQGGEAEGEQERAASNCIST